MRRRGLPLWLPVLAAAGLMLPGCKDDEGRANDDAAGTTTDDGSEEVGTGSTGGEEETGDDDGEEVVFEMSSVFGLPNLDDDDENGQADWLQTPFAADNDVSKLSVPGVPDGYEVELALAGDLDNIRIWDPNGFILGHGSDPVAVTTRFAPGPDGVDLDIEFADYNTTGSLAVSLLDPEGSVVESLTLDLRSSPMIMNHHLQPMEQAWVIQRNGNESMIADMEAVLGSRLTKVTGIPDVWIQDQFEMATSVNADGQRLDTVINSIRNFQSGLEHYAPNNLVQPDWVVGKWGTQNPSTFDSFGNLEASPPVTAGGVEYPFGRIYWGREGQWGPDPALEAQLDAQQIQAPFRVPTNWLCVGHVDEFQTFVPDPTSPKGFKFLFADVPSAYEILEGLDPSTNLPRFAPNPPNGHGMSTVGDLLSASVRAYNDDIQALRLDPILEQFKTELGLDDDDIILIPALWEHVPNCGTLALIPGTVNLMVANLEDKDHLFIPDPFVRSNAADQSSDPFIQDFAARMPNALELHFVDNWYVYHLNFGEVHCGTNTRRTPLASWFESAMHLLEN